MNNNTKGQYTDLEVSKIEKFCADKEMLDAVKKVLLEGIYSHGTIGLGYTPNPLLNGAFSLVSLSTNNPIPDEIIGQQLRAQWAGVNALHNAFGNLSNIKLNGIESPIDVNEAI
jgi:hypothetical protein